MRLLDSVKSGDFGVDNCLNLWDVTVILRKCKKLLVNGVINHIFTIIYSTLGLVVLTISVHMHILGLRG